MQNRAKFTCKAARDSKTKSEIQKKQKIRCFVNGEGLIGWHRRTGSEGGPWNGSLQKNTNPRREFGFRAQGLRAKIKWPEDSWGHPAEGRGPMRTLKHARPGRPVQQLWASRGEDARSAPGTSGPCAGPQAAGKMGRQKGDSGCWHRGARSGRAAHAAPGLGLRYSPLRTGKPRRW